MKGDVEEETPRPRPLSAGIWTLFSWLRRTERSSSSESITSVGSDRTAASFDFLAPLHYNHIDRHLVLPQTPITDTYRKRLQERNIRRLNDRDLTLRRKYGLYTEEELGYDAFSLPPSRKAPKDSARQRRATSEIIQRRAAYVPGKRRAPLPPTVVIAATLPRNYKRKRPAPKPPLKLIVDNKENINIQKNLQMNSKPVGDKNLFDTNNSLESKIEKGTKQDTSKDVKLRTEKSFLKQIFDNRKRNSAIDTTHVKLLPSISELDKQAAEIIQTNRLLCANNVNNSNGNNEIFKHAEIASSTEGNWICTICLRKYKSTIIACVYCVSNNGKEKAVVNVNISCNAINTSSQTENKRFVTNRNSDINEKKKLREMLKEMKDSLPKRPKHEKGNKFIILPDTETPTLRIGSTIKDKNYCNKILSNDTRSNNVNDAKVNIQQAKNSFLMPQPSSSKQIVSDIVLSNLAPPKKERKEYKFSCNNNILQASSSNATTKFLNIKENKDAVMDNSKDLMESVNKELVDSDKEKAINKNLESKILHINKANKVNGEIKTNIITNAEGVSKMSHSTNQYVGSISKIKTPKELIKDQKSVSVSVELPNTAHLTAPINTSIQNSLKLDDKINLKNDYNHNNKIAQENFTSNFVLVPLKEIEIPDQNAARSIKTKIETVRIGDVISPNMIQRSENKGNVNVPNIGSDNNNLHTPLKISSLLNPLYCPKSQRLDDKNKLPKSSGRDTNSSVTPKPKSAKDNIDIPKSFASETSLTLIEQERKEPRDIKEIASERSKENVPSPNSEQSHNFKTYVNNFNHHVKRRDLVTQLEQAIAKGDEQAAAEAAAKLAKLKLSCSVLSFSSQIVGESLVALNKKDVNDKVMNETQQMKEKAIPNSNIKSEIKLHKGKAELTEATINDNNNKLINITNGIKVEQNAVQNSIPTTSKQILQSPEEIVPIAVWVEDKEATRGPIHLRVPRKAMVGELKKQAEISLGLEIRLQRWIIGRALCSNDSTPLVTLAGPDLNAPFYLCLVESEPNKDIDNETKNTTGKNTCSNETKNVKTGDFYTELIKLEQQALVPNTQEFECGVCIEQCPVGAGAILRDCIHTFCKECLCDVVRHCEDPVVTCPAIGCPGVLQEREIRALLAPEEYERWLARGLAAAESGTRNTFHCRTKDCTGWAFCEPGVWRFPCPVCKHTNCLPCQALHEGETCEEYQAKLRKAVNAVEANQSDEGTQALLKSLIDKGEALECPECKAIITKKWGCDWIKCSACKTEICWVTKGRRWGPGGKGDTSGGCRCGIDGKRCHPSCGYCH